MSKSPAKASRKGFPSSHAALVSEQFPPLSTSLSTLLVSESDHEFRQLVYSILGVSELFTKARSHFASIAGVTSFQYGMMLAIAEAETITVGFIAAKLRVSSPFVAAEMAKLESKGIIHRRPKQNDRRGGLIELTQRGAQLVRKVGPIRQSTNDIIFSGLTRNQTRQLNKIIQILRANTELALSKLEGTRPEGRLASLRNARPSSST